MGDHPTIHHLPKEERIRAIAYALWEEEGRPEGRNEEHWFRALQLVEVEAEPVSDPDWLRRDAQGEAPAAEVPATAIDEIVRRMAASRAA